MKRLGPVMVDVEGLTLSGEERRFLGNPLIGAVILFARNYHDPVQLRMLTSEIRSLREPELLICVDHEGGRVQRFRAGFTAIPPMRCIGNLWSEDRAYAMRMARAVGTVIGSELSRDGLDFSFTPVLDVDYGHSRVIGDRSFSSDPEVVGMLGGELTCGLSDAGSAAVGKHFPGHGFVSADSHVALPCDERSLQEIEGADLIPFRLAMTKGLAGVMPAHVIYSAVDQNPAGFSRYWIQDVLRKSMGFEGVIFSDDLSMEGAVGAGGITDRGRAALAAGCDMVLVCNAPEDARRLVGEIGSVDPLRTDRVAKMKARAAPDGETDASRRYDAALDLLSRLSV